MPKDTNTAISPHHTHHILKKHTSIVAGFVILVAIGAIAIWVSLRPGTPAKITKAAKNVTFPIYYPSQLPPGYTLDDSTVSSTSSVMLFSVVNSTTGSRLVISEQPKPNDLDFQDYYHGQYRKFDSFATPAGDGVIGDAGDSYIVNIPGNKTWIIIKGPLSSGDTIRSLSMKLQQLSY